MYQECLEKSGYKFDFKYKPDPNFGQDRRKKCRSRDFIWYNPPYDKGVKTHIGIIFLKTLNESFPKSHPLHKVFNWNTVKISYCTMPNIEQQISGLNKMKLRGGDIPEPDLTCNSRENPCPLQGECNARDIVYNATITHNNSTKVSTYVGLTSCKFIQRYRLQKRSFNNETLNKDTTLAEKVWELTKSNSQYSVSFKIEKMAQSYTPGKPSCNLCLEEKYVILKSVNNDNVNPLNSQAELFSNCRHKTKFKFVKVS